MTDADPTVWLTIPDLVDELGIPQGRVRRLLEEGVLLGVRRAGVLQVPADFLREGEPLRELRGTLTVLADAGYSDEDSMAWLLGVQESLGTTPIAALRSGRKAEVRRVAQSLGF
ncbi:MAG: DNA-binding protein [Micrococcales bacterium]|nr:DNA-binding protein [Micrococcales bacterium]